MSKSKLNKLIEFIKSVYSEREYIPIHEPIFIGNEKKYINECLDKTFVSSVGKFVGLFEEKLAEFTKSKRAIACMNGTSALHLSLHICGIQPEDEVIVPSLSFIATANSIMYNYAKPIFIDIDKETLGLSPEKLKHFLSANTTLSNGKCINKKTSKVIKACIPVHTLGHPCRIKQIINVCNEYNIQVIEDAAESIGSKLTNKHTGTFGKFGIISFNGNKTITTGGGGVILTQDEKLADLAKHLSTHAKVKHPWEYYHDMIGFNYRMPNINAALGVAQLEILPQLLKTKRKLALKYKDFCDSINLDFFIEPENCISNYWLNAILFENRIERNDFLHLSNNNGIQTRPAWNLLVDQQMYKNCQTGDLSNSRWIVERLVNLPSFPPHSPHPYSPQPSLL